MHAHTQEHTHTDTDTNRHTDTPTRTQTHAHRRTGTYTHSHTHTDTHTHMHTDIKVQPKDTPWQTLSLKQTTSECRKGPTRTKGEYRQPIVILIRTSQVLPSVNPDGTTALHLSTKW